MMKIRQCDICMNDFRTGIRVKVRQYELRKIFKLWIPIPSCRKIYICTKCEDTMRGLVRNYRKERISDF